MRDCLFPDDRFASLIPETDRLAKHWQRSLTEDTYVPKTSRELGDESKPVLHQFFPAWDVQAYVRMAHVSLHVNNAKYPAFEVTGELPQLNDGNFLVPKDEILTHLQTFHADLDAGLTEVDKSEAFAYRGLVHEKLRLVLAYCRWVDPITFKEVTRPQLKKIIPFPLNRMLPKKMHVEAVKSLTDYGMYSKEHAFTIARDCYTALDAKLATSDGPFFFGDKPTALDAAVFGHIVDALSTPLLHQMVLEVAPLLVAHAEKIRDVFFFNEDDANRPVIVDAEYSENAANAFSQSNTHFMKQVPTSTRVQFVEPYRSLNWSRRELMHDIVEQKKQEQSEKEPSPPGFEKSTRNVIIGAVAALVLYALAHLPLQIQFADDGELDDDDDDDDEYDEENDDEGDYADRSFINVEGLPDDM